MSPDPREAVERLLGELVARGELTGASVALVDGARTDLVTVGFADLAQTVPLGPDARFRLASVTKPIVAALGLALVEDGVLGLDDPIGRWVPELAEPRVMRDAHGRVDDLVPAVRPVLVRHLLDSTCGWGFPGDLSLPGVAPMLAAVGDGRHRHELPAPDGWVAALADAPMLFQPGERWLYDTSSDLLGVVLARAAGRPLPELLEQRLLGPLGMHGTGFATASADLAEPVRRESAALHPAEHADASVPPRFPSGAGGLIGRIGDLTAFARMLLADGAGVLGGASVHAMTTDRLTPEQRSEGGAFLDGQSWGYGGMVDVAPAQPWQAAGRYGWVGVAGTSLHVHRDQGTAVVVLTARELHTAQDMALLGAIWTAACIR